MTDPSMPVPPVFSPPPAPTGKPLKLILKRSRKSGLIGGRKIEIAVSLETDRNLAALFKSYPDELVMAYRSAFVDKNTSLKRSELIRGSRFAVATLNEVIELEDRLLQAFDQLKRMIAIIDGLNAGLDFET